MKTFYFETHRWIGVTKSLSSPVVRRLSVYRNLAVTRRCYLTGASGVGELLANTLAVRNVTVVVLDVKPIVTENCERPTQLNHRSLSEYVQITFPTTSAMYLTGNESKRSQRL